MGGKQLNWLFFSDCIAVYVVYNVYEVYNGDSNSITMWGNVSTGVFLFSAPKSVLVRCTGVRPCDYFAPFLFLGSFYIQ